MPASLESVKVVVVEAAGAVEFLPGLRAPAVAEQLAITNVANQMGQASPGAERQLLLEQGLANDLFESWDRFATVA